MQRRFARFTRHLWFRCIHAGVLLAALVLAACATTSVPQPPVADCVQPLSPPLYWVPNIIAVGLTSSGSISTGDLGDVQGRINSLLPEGLSVSPYQPKTEDGIPTILPFASGHTAVAFFMLQSSGSLSGKDCLGRAIDTINASDLSHRTTSGGHIYIAGASPDWLTIGGGGGNGVGGSPSGPPTGASTQTPPTSTGSAGADTMVFVLDTADPVDPVSGRTFSWGATPLPLQPLPAAPTAQCSSGCTLLTDLSAKAQEADMAADTMNATTQSPDECAYIAAYQWYFIPPGSTPPPCPAVPNTFREHGLFVGEIIHHLAPGATIRLIRVLNDYGAGDIRTVIAALHAIPSMVGESRSVVVNLSLSVEPTVHCLLSFWRAQYPLPNIRTPPCDDKNPLIVNSSGSIVDATPLYVPFGLAVEDLATRPTDTAPRYTVVAAAGNDQDHDATMPGAFCGVKDVAAAQSLAQSASPIYSPASASLASFSNLPYVAPNQCLSVQPSPPSGANTNSQAAAQVQLKPIDPNDALIAIGTNICSLHPYFALGIADWQGTSFAAAFISGNIAANSGTLPSSLDQTMPCNPDRSG